MRTVGPVPAGQNLDPRPGTSKPPPNSATARPPPPPTARPWAGAKDGEGFRPVAGTGNE